MRGIGQDPAGRDVHEDVVQGGLKRDHERFGAFTGLVALLRSKQGAGDAPYSDSKTRGPAPYAATFYRGYS
jgi:hypothetical protein